MVVANTAIPEPADVIEVRVDRMATREKEKTAIPEKPVAVDESAGLVDESAGLVVAENLIAYLRGVLGTEGSGDTFKIIDHQPVRTSEEAAQVRGTELRAGAKAMLFKAKVKGLNAKGSGSDHPWPKASSSSTANPTSQPTHAFYLVVISAAVKISNPQLKVVLGSKDIKQASSEEVLQLTGCQPGAVPPFPMIPGRATNMSTHSDATGNARSNGNAFNKPQLRSIFFDQSIGKQDMTSISFNCGLKTKSVTMPMSSWIKVVDDLIEKGFASTGTDSECHVAWINVSKEDEEKIHKDMLQQRMQWDSATAAAGE